jgi:hypothetical protein
MYTVSQKKWSALIIALVVLTLLTMMSTVFFEKVFRFSQRSEGIENSNVAYYKSLGIIEEALYTGWVNKYTPWNILNNSHGSNTTSGSAIAVSTGWTTIPVAWKGNSPYNKDYNIISIGSPTQIVIPSGITWANVNFEFRVPIILGNTNTGVAAWGTNSGYVLWTLASSGSSLFASGETNIFQWYKINSLVPANLRIHNYNGTTNSGSSITFDNFYTDANYLGVGGAKCGDFQCTLKLSLIRTIPTEAPDSRNMSFLEYRISWLNKAIPAQYMDIHAEWYAYGFLRSHDVQFPQITTNTALDFAVLQ